MTASGCGYAAGMTDAVSAGMVFVLSNWKGDTSWLDKGKCGGSCNVDPTLNISNLTIVTGGAPGPHPGPGPSPSPINPADYTFGNACATAHDDLCAVMNCPSADHCRWSWPNGTSAGDPNAHCRCDEITQ